RCLDLLVRRVAVARVELGGARGRRYLGEVLGRVGAKRRRLPDGRRDGVRPVLALARVYGARLHAVAVRLVSAHPTHPFASEVPRGSRAPVLTCPSFAGNDS